MRNNNRAVIRKISVRSFTANKSRNLFALTAIILTTVMITAVFTIGISLADGMQQMMIHNYGRSTEVNFQYLTGEETERIISHPLIEEYGLSRGVSTISHGIFRQMHGEIHTADDKFADFTFTRPTTGSMPEKENEIALMSWILDAMGLPRELGQELHLDFEVDGKPVIMDFTVCGFWDNDMNLNPYGIMYVSDHLADKLLENVDPAQARMEGSYDGVTKLTANIDGRLSRLEENVDRILKDTGIDRKDAGVLLNGAYTSSGSGGGMTATIALVITIILVSGYLLIYNIFYISVMRDVRFYGLLKTIGTTRKQIGRIVNLQALTLCVAGIPVGLLVGYMLGILLIPVLLRIIDIDYRKAALNPWIFLLGTVLSLVTVLISCYGPAKKASKISPVEAVRFTNVAVCGKKVKRGGRGAKLYRMSVSNVLRTKKKAVLVIASLSVGLILFNIVYTYINSYDINKFLQQRIHGDFLIAATDYFNFARPYEPDYLLKNHILEQVEALDGVREIAKVYYEKGIAPIEGDLLAGLEDYRRREIAGEEPSLSQEEIERIIKDKDTAVIYGGSIHAQVYGFGSYWLDKLEENLVEGTFDREKFLTGDYVMLGHDGEGMLKAGDTVTLSLGKNGGEKRMYEVMGRVDYTKLNSLSAHSVSMPGFSVYLPSSQLEGLPHPSIMSATVMAEENAVQGLQREMGRLLDGNADLDFRSRADYLAEMKSENQQFSVIGFTMCAVILVIGIMNYINTTMTNIFARRQELAMLQSVGMTAGQTKIMLVLESICYIGGTLAVFVTVGYGISYFAVNTITRNSASYTYQFSFLPLLICFPVLLLTACILPVGVFHTISKDSVVQRLRE